MKSTNNIKLVRSGVTVLFTALICLGCFVSHPLPGGVPITVQNMLASLSGLVLGGLQGAGAVGLFLVLGALGLPVFSGVKGGISVIQGPTGGYLIGYFLGALIGGLILGSPLKKEKKTVPFIIRTIIASVFAFALQYAVGIPWFMAVMESSGKENSFAEVLSETLIPFIPGDIIKLILSVILAFVLRPVAGRTLYPNDAKEAEEILRRLEQRKRQQKGY